MMNGISYLAKKVTEVHMHDPDTQKLERLAFLADLPYCKHTSEDWEEELRLECELQDHPQYISFLNR